MSTLGLGGWQVQSSAVVGRDGAIISEPEYPTGPWLYVTPDDAGAPGTEIEALLQSGACPNVFYSTNMRTCFGYEPDVGQVRVPEFAVPWWFRTDFELIESSGTMVDLIINGVVGAADVFVDGHEVANHTEVTGDYTRFTFDVSGLVKPGQKRWPSRSIPTIRSACSPSTTSTGTRCPRTTTPASSSRCRSA